MSEELPGQPPLTGSSPTPVIRILAPKKKKGSVQIHVAPSIVPELQAWAKIEDRSLTSLCNRILLRALAERRNRNPVNLDSLDRGEAGKSPSKVWHTPAGGAS